MSIGANWRQPSLGRRCLMCAVERRRTSFLHAERVAGVLFEWVMLAIIPIRTASDGLGEADRCATPTIQLGPQPVPLPL